MKRLSFEEKEKLRQELAALFLKYDLDVGTGITSFGVAIRSRDQRLDCCNTNTVFAQKAFAV